VIMGRRDNREPWERPDAHQLRRPAAYTQQYHLQPQPQQQPQVGPQPPAQLMSPQAQLAAPPQAQLAPSQAQLASPPAQQLGPDAAWLLSFLPGHGGHPAAPPAYPAQAWTMSPVNKPSVPPPPPQPRVDPAMPPASAKRKRENYDDGMTAEQRELEFLNKQSRQAAEQLHKRAVEQLAPSVGEFQAAPERIRRSVPKAQFWYYKDSEKKMQGPFYPGQMKQWFDGGFLPASLSVGPSLHGEVPTELHPIGALFEQPLSEKAFKAGPGIAHFPPEEEPEKPEVTREQLLEELNDFKGQSKLLYYGMC